METNDIQLLLPGTYTVRDAFHKERVYMDVSDNVAVLTNYLFFFHQNVLSVRYITLKVQ